MLFDRYIKNKRGKAAVFGLAFILVLSLFAEFIANDKPIILKYQGEYFFPIAKVYTDARFGFSDRSKLQRRAYSQEH